MNLPLLPITREALTLTLQMCALYWSVRWLHNIEKNLLAAIAPLLLVIFNIVMVGWFTGDWLKTVKL